MASSQDLADIQYLQSENHELTRAVEYTKEELVKMKSKSALI